MEHTVIRVTDDGSHTIYNKLIRESYHSSFGAIQESMHIFINAGLNQFREKTLEKINIFEVGVGTGLNVILTYLWSLENKIGVDYFGIEPFPISVNLLDKLNYPEKTGVNSKILEMTQDFTGKAVPFSDIFNYKGESTGIQDVILKREYYDLVFFDAFSPEVQPELWNTDIFQSLYKSLVAGGILTTYSCKGIVKRSLKAAGFKVEKLPGPPGKREFIRAIKR